jgi:hypothetical protein
LDLTPAEINFRHTTPPFAPAAVDEESYGLWRNRYALAQKQKGMYSLMVPFVHGNNSPDVFYRSRRFRVSVRR